MLATDADPLIRRQTWDALDLIVDDSTRDGFFGVVINHLDIEQFRTLLTDTDPVVRTRVRWVDTRSYNRPLVTMALGLLADERFAYAWPECIEVLRRPIDVDRLLEALTDAASDELAARLLVTLGLPASTRLPEIPPELPASPIECPYLPWKCGAETTHQCRHLPVVVALLGSSFESVRQDAMRALYRSGLGTVDLLRSVRRSNPSMRRAALTVLAEFGWQHIPAEDLLILRRLIRMKQRIEEPEPRDGIPDGAWYALRTTDQAAVLDALDLTDPVPATMRMGFAWPWDATMYGPRGHRYPEVFVTPALDGWTLVFCNDALGAATPGSTSIQSRYAMYRRMEQLSQRFGIAHWYESFGEYSYGEFVSSQWCIARDGEISMHCVSSDDVWVYRCEEDDPVDSLGELNEWIEANTLVPCSAQEDRDRAAAYAAVLDERAGDDRLPPEGEEPDYARTDRNDDYATNRDQDLVFGAHSVAQRLSIDLQSLGPHTTVVGTGVLAVPRSLRHLLRRGALPI